MERSAEVQQSALGTSGVNTEGTAKRGWVGVARSGETVCVCLASAKATPGQQLVACTSFQQSVALALAYQQYEGRAVKRNLGKPSDRTC